MIFNLELDVDGFKLLVESDARILDFGCGYGRNCQLLYSLGFKNIFGVDTSYEMIRRGNEQFPYLTLLCSEDGLIDFPDAHFDAVIVCAVMTCIPEWALREKVISEINRVLKPSGLIHMVEFCNEKGETFESKVGVTMRHSQPNELKQLVSNFHLEKLQTITTKTMRGDGAHAVSLFARK